MLVKAYDCLLYWYVVIDNVLVLLFNEISVIREILKSSLIITYIQYKQWNNKSFCQIRVHQLQFFCQFVKFKGCSKKLATNVLYGFKFQ